MPYKDPNKRREAQRRYQRRRALAARKRKERKAAKAAVESAPPEQKHIQVLLVDHRRDTVQRFNVPVTSEKRISGVRNLEQLLEFYRAGECVIVEIEKER